MSEITYITPRLAIINQITEAIETLKNNHGTYFYVFNLSGQHQTMQTELTNSLKIKNRGFPFSYKITLQICMQLDRYFYKGLSNTASFYCPENQFGACVIICYMYISGRFKQISHASDYFLSKCQMNLPTRWILNFQQFFDNLNIVMPPIKILKKVVLVSELQLVPLYEVSKQSRFQELQSVYQHPIKDQLQQHYYHAMKANHHTKKPQTNYVFKPVVLSGDFRIDLYSYETMKANKILSIGFNTLFVDTDTLSFQGTDLYQNKINQNSQVILQFDDYCKCTSEMLYSERCYHCVEELKTIKKQYNQLIDLSSQFTRNRKMQTATKLLFGNSQFDDVKN